MPKYENSNTHQILMFIREHPEGVRKAHVANKFSTVPKSSVDGILARLQNHSLVYSDGTMGVKGATWFPVTHNGVNEPFPTIAAELVAELRDIHYDRHELHLAKRLEEIFGDKEKL